MHRVLIICKVRLAYFNARCRIKARPTRDRSYSPAVAIKSARAILEKRMTFRAGKSRILRRKHPEDRRDCTRSSSSARAATFVTTVTRDLHIVREFTMRRCPRTGNELSRIYNDASSPIIKAGRDNRRGRQWRGRRCLSQLGRAPRKEVMRARNTCVKPCAASSRESAHSNQFHGGQEFAVPRNTRRGNAPRRALDQLSPFSS